MRLAAARGMLAFFLIVIFLVMFSDESMKKMNFWEALGGIAFLAFIVAGAIFAYTWHNYEQEEVKLRREVARQELSKDGDGFE